MKKTYTIPYYNIKGNGNKNTIKKAIELLNDQYMINWEVMNDDDRIKLLETIASLTRIYLDMEYKEV